MGGKGESSVADLPIKTSMKLVNEAVVAVLVVTAFQK